MSSIRQQLPVLVNPVLSYGHVRMQHATLEEVHDSLFGIFEEWEFGRAKDALWDHLAKAGNDGAEIIGEKPKRNRSSTRSAAKAHCDDLLKALRDLDAVGALPNLAVDVDDLVELPPITPCLITQKRQATLDKHLSLVEEELHHSQHAAQEALASIQEAQSKMAEELAKIHQRLDGHSDLAPATSTPKALNTSNAPAADDRMVADGSPPTCPRKEEELSVGASHMCSDQLAQQPWHVAGRPKRRKRRIVVGTTTGDDAGCFGGAPEVRSVFVYNAKKSSTEDAVRRWVQRQNVDVLNIRVMSHVNAVCKSFKVTVPKDQVRKLLNKDFKWPLDVKVRHFIPSFG